MLGLGTWLFGTAVALDLARRALAAGRDRPLAIVAAVVVAAEAILTLLALIGAVVSG